MADRHDSKQAEKTYLSRTGGSAWEREKPFSPPGDETLDDSLELLHDFAVAAKLLQPSADDRIVDLGAGGGWCSDLLQRLNRKSVAVDISLEMLQVSRERRTRVPDHGGGRRFRTAAVRRRRLRQGDLPERASSRARHGRRRARDLRAS